jgi:hypothetical protein
VAHWFRLIVAVGTCVGVLPCSTPAWAQNERTMRFSTGAADRTLDITVAYLDPDDVDARLTGEALWPVRLTLRNTSEATQTVRVEDLRLNVGGSLELSPVAPAAIAAAVLARHRPALARVLGGQSSAFQPTALRAVIERQQFRDGPIGPRQERSGVVLFPQPAASDAPSFNGVLSLEVRGYPAQLLSTKKVDVQTKGDREPTFLERFTAFWNTYIAGRRPPFSKSYALLIGVGDYRTLPKLSAPASDVQKMADFLRAQGFDEVITIRDAAVTRDVLRFPQKYFESKMRAPIGTTVTAEDRFLFYYSGHGMSVETAAGVKGYLPLVGERPGGTDQSVGMTDLVAWLKGLTAKHVLILLDACFSGLAVDGVEIKSAAVFESKVDAVVLDRLASKPGKYLLMAGNEKQEAVASSRWNGSLFTDAVIRGLRQAADTNPDRIVTTRELHVWLQDFVPREAQKVNHELTPLLKDLGPGVSQGEFVFLR